MESNKVEISGIIESELEFNNKQYGESFYNMIISVGRDSGIKDYIPLLISERIINIRENYIGKCIRIIGQFRSYNCHEESKCKLLLSVFVRELEFIDELECEASSNCIYLDGYICKAPIYRMTPLGREIADVLLAVNRAYGKSDYIPCICWGRNARFAGKLEVGEHVAIWGRIQSREYQKKLENEEVINKVAYEVSVSKMECLD